MTDAPPEPVARLLQAANDHDTDAFLAGFTDDGVSTTGAASSRAPTPSADGATRSSSAST